MKLPPAMTADAVRRIFAALGGDTQIRFVGGCVRNALLGEEVVDIDLATRHSPNEVAKRLKAAKIKVVPTGLAHGTVTAVCDGQGYEITTLRRDLATDGRHAEVAFTEDWQEDAARRDFTMNALYADLAGRVYDPLGTGLRDLERRRVVFVGDPAKRIAEDYLRVLRFFRFHVRYGKGGPDRAALAACAAASRKLKTLSKERVTQEILKILTVAKCPSSLSLMREHGLLGNIIAASYEEEALKSLIKKQKDDIELASRLLLLGEVKKLETNLRLPKRMIDLMGQILAARKTLKQLSAHKVRLSLYKHGRQATVQALYIEKASASLVEQARTVDIPVFPVAGRDLLRLGHEAGPGLGAELARLEKLWIRSDFKAISPRAAATSK